MKLLLAGALALALLLTGSASLPAQTDQFGSLADSPLAPARHAVAITPSDSADLATVPKAIYVGTGGDVKLIGVGAPAGANGVVFKNVPTGSILDVRARRVLATGTTATDLVALL